MTMVEGPPIRQVLLVEDEPSQATIVKALLERNGYQVTLVTSGAEAEQAVFTRRPDLMILDLLLPDGNGMDALARIRRFYSAAELPVVIVSANDREEFLERAEALEVAEFLTKPARTRTMLEAIDLALDRNRVPKQ